MAVALLEPRIEIAFDVLARTPPKKLADLVRNPGSLDVEEGELLAGLHTPQGRPALALLMHYEKYLERDDAELAEVIENIANEEHSKYNIKNIKKSVLPFGLNYFPEDEQRLLIKYIQAYQSVQGCKGDCNKKCNVDAPKGIRARNSVQTVREFAVQKSKTEDGVLWLPYYACDPLYMAASYKGLKSIFEKLSEQSENIFDIKTEIPPGTEETYKRLVNDGFGKLLSVSLHEHNIRRLHKAGITKYEFMSSVPVGRIVFNSEGWYSQCEPKQVFVDGLAPREINLTKFIQSGINGNPGCVPACDVSLTILTPYGVVNAAPTEDCLNHPQGMMVVGLKPGFSEYVAGRDQLDFMQDPLLSMQNTLITPSQYLKKKHAE